MKAHFLRLFDYDYTVNQLIFGTLRECPPGSDAVEKPMALMAHLLVASALWLQRLQGKSDITYNLWPKPEWGDMSAQIEANAHGWKAYLESVHDFNQSITYQNQSGKTYANVLSDILSHVVNHGTHHRAQIGQLLKFGGLEHLPVTDYIAYLRLKS